MNTAAAIADEDERARIDALDPSRSFIVQAPAGSGKTTVLTERLLNLLLTVDEPEEILAITFTRKAAAEMLARIVRSLRSVDQPRQPHERRGWDLAQRVRARSRERGWALEHSSSRLRVMTIDALNLSIAAQLPVAARVGGRLQVTDDVGAVYLRAAQRTLEYAESEPALRPHVERLLLRADNDWSKLAESLATMLQIRGHWMAHLQGEADGSLRTRVENSLRAVIAAALARASEAIAPEVLRQGCTVLSRAATNLKHGSTPCLDHWRASTSILEPTPEQLGLWREFARYALLADLSAFRKRPNAKEGIAVTDEALKRDSRQWLQSLRDSAGALSALQEIAKLPALRLSDEDAAALESIAVLLKQGTAALHLLFAETGRVDHVYVAGAARQALLTTGDPTELALRLGNRLRHILVDEFQDTSVRQVQMLELLTADWQRGDGRSLFLVGDPMQSIYLFRETDVGLFLQACAGWLGSVALEKLELRRNFRSVPVVVDFANQTFGRIFPARAEARAGAVTHLSSIAARGDDAADLAAVRMHCVDAADPLAESVCVTQIVRAHLDHRSDARIAVLVRSRLHARPITEQLLAAGITVAGVDLVPLGEVGVVQDLASLARALRHDGDRIAWLAVLRAPWCGARLADLDALVRDAPQSTVPELLAQADRLALLSDDGRRRMQRVAALIAHAQLSDAHLPGTLQLETLWRALGGPAACASDAELLHARRFFDVLAEHIALHGWPEPNALETMLEALFAEPTPGAVQIMTVHKSKGLEFDVVILPGLNRSTRADAATLMHWVELPREHPHDDQELTDLLMAPLTPADAAAKDPLCALIDRLRKHREQHERVRLLYVAVTRARDTLHLVASMADVADARPHTGSALATLWPAIAAQFSQSRPSDDSVTLRAPDTRLPLRRLAADWRAPTTAAPIGLESLSVARVEPLERPEFVWVAELGRHVGTVVHGELQRASRMNLAEFSRQLEDREFTEPHMRRLLAAQDLDARLIPEAVQRVRTALQRTLADERGRWILSAGHREAHSEFALSGMHSGRLTQAVVDRWLVDQAGDCWVIDYKTSSHEGGNVDEFIRNELRRYTPQLQRYRDLSRGLGYAHVRAALYFPLLGRFEELSAQ